MAAQHVYPRGWLDTLENIRATFHDDQLIRALKTRNATRPVNHRHFNVTTASKWAYILTYGAYKVASGRIPDQYHIQAVSIGELIAPVLPDNYFLPEREANAAVRAILLYYADNETIVNRGRTKNTFITAHNVLASEEAGGEEPAGQLPLDMESGAFINAHGESFVEFLLVASSTESSLSPIDIFTTLYVAVAKRGNVTDDFIGKITRGLLDDLQHDAKLSAETISLVYKFYGGFINASNAQQIMDRWLQDIPEIALRVRLTLQQATNSGLTALVTCGRAINKYPDFPWSRLNSLTGGELTNFSIAVGMVQGNQYYGFNKSLGAARSTLYSSIAYVAKELLISLNGETSLRKYAGWIRAPRNAAVVKTLIDNYKQTYTARMETGEISEADAELSQALIAELSSARNANLFT